LAIEEAAEIEQNEGEHNNKPSEQQIFNEAIDSIEALTKDLKMPKLC
jgi:hypothetical protein